MRVLRPVENLLAFYDGRVHGRHIHSEEPNWVDGGAFGLGIAAYALVSGQEALVYDTHITVDHARLMRATLEAFGIRKITVVLSHHHLDHIAGNAVFADCPIIAREATAEALRRDRQAIEDGTKSGPPGIAPLTLPTDTFEGDRRLRVGDIDVVLRPVDIHSHDGLLLTVPSRGWLLAGDALEDTVTYVAEPDGLDRHLGELSRVASWGIGRLLPNHGHPERIAAGGYDPGLIDATRRYIKLLLQARTEATVAETDLRTLLAEDLANGSIGYFPPYEAVHRDNLAAVGAVR